MASQRGGNGNGEMKKQEMVAVAIDKDKGSQAALKWAVDHLLGKGRSVTLVHVKVKTSSFPLGSHIGFSNNDSTKDLFLPFRCFCTRKDIQVTEVVLEDTDIAKAVCDYVKNNFIETLVVGSSPKNGFVRFKTVDIPGNINKMAPEFCTVYVISKGKVTSCRSPPQSAPREARSLQNSGSLSHDARFGQANGARGSSSLPYVAKPMEETDSIRSPFTRGKANRSYGELSMSESDISFVGTARPSSDRMMSPFNQDPFMPARLSNSSDPDSRMSFGSPFSNARSSDATGSFGVYSSSSEDSGISWSGSQSMEEVEAEMRRLKQELKQTMDMYSTACKEALTAKQKVLL